MTRNSIGSNKSRTSSATLATVGYSVIFGFSFMASRIALMHTSSHMLLAVRFTAAMAVMLLLLITGICKMDLRGKPVGLFLLMGFSQPVVYFIGETRGIQYTNSSFAGIMISLIPVVTAILSAVFLHERLKASTLGWIMCTVVGAFIISIAQTKDGAIRVTGILFLLLAVLSASVFYIISRSVADKFTPFERTFIMMMMGFVFFTGQALIKEGADFVPLFADCLRDSGVMLPVVYLAVISSVVAFFLQNYAVTYLDLAKVTVFENIIPVISVIAGILFLKEPFSLIQLAGIILILLGVWKVSTQRD